MSDAMAFNNFENLKIPTITTLGKTDNSLFTISQFLCAQIPKGGASSATLGSSFRSDFEFYCYI